MNTLQNKIDIGVSEFCRNAETNMYNYFSNSQMNSLYLSLREYGATYDAR